MGWGAGTRRGGGAGGGARPGSRARRPDPGKSLERSSCSSAPRGQRTRLLCRGAEKCTRGRTRSNNYRTRTPLWRAASPLPSGGPGDEGEGRGRRTPRAEPALASGTPRSPRPGAAQGVRPPGWGGGSFSASEARSPFLHLPRSLGSGANFTPGFRPGHPRGALGTEDKWMRGRWCPPWCPSELGAPCCHGVVPTRGGAWGAGEGFAESPGHSEPGPAVAFRLLLEERPWAGVQEPLGVTFGWERAAPGQKGSLLLHPWPMSPCPGSAESKRINCVKSRRGADLAAGRQTQRAGLQATAVVPSPDSPWPALGLSPSVPVQGLRISCGEPLTSWRRMHRGPNPRWKVFAWRRGVRVRRAWVGGVASLTESIADPGEDAETTRQTPPLSLCPLSLLSFFSFHRS